MLNNEKKSNATLENKRFIFVLMGFIVALSVLYIGFEWTAKFKVVDIHPPIQWIDDGLDIPITQEPPPPPPPPPPDLITDVIKIVPDDVVVDPIQLHNPEEDGRETPPPLPFIPIDEEIVIPPFYIVEQMPKFPGGQQALMRWLSTNIRYPALAIQHNIEGRVFIQFTVNADGSIEDIQIVRSADPLLDREAVRVAHQMPNWIPGKQREQPVRVRLTLPITFQLQQQR